MATFYILQAVKKEATIWRRCPSKRYIADWLTKYPSVRAVCVFRVAEKIKREEPIAAPVVEEVPVLVPVAAGRKRGRPKKVVELKVEEVLQEVFAVPERAALAPVPRGYRKYEKVEAAAPVRDVVVADTEGYTLGAPDPEAYQFARFDYKNEA